MADSSAQQKTEEATAKRKRDARKKGQVARSRELSTGLVVIACVMAVMMAGHDLAGKGLALMRGSLQFEPGLLDDPHAQVTLMFTRMLEAFVAVSPIAFASVAAAVAATVLLGGWNFSSQAFQPQWSRINPLSGIGRMFSTTALVELGKSLLKFSVLGAVGALYIWNHRDRVLALSSMDVASAVAELLNLALWTLVWLSGALAVVAFVDAPYQWWKHRQELRMTKQEVREELKESDGRPEVKSRIRQLQHQMARRRMMEQVPKADVVVTNPTHYAVAIRYSAGKMRAPIVVAKGAGVIAMTIRELATQHKVPLVSAPPLARALYRSVELDREIPSQLYQSVATVLTYIYQLRNGTLRTAPDFSVAVPGGEPDPER